jgi:hypothetical protein
VTSFMLFQMLLSIVLLLNIPNSKLNMDIEDAKCIYKVLICPFSTALEMVRDFVL